MTTEEWLREYDLYSRLKRVSLFNCFRLTKTFQTWKRVVKRQKFASASRSLVETSAIFGDVKMRDCFLQVSWINTWSQGAVVVDLGLTSPTLDALWSQPQTTGYNRIFEL